MTIKKTFSVRLTVISVFFLVACLTAGLSLGLQYYFSQGLAKTAAERSFRITAEKIGERVRTLDGQSANLVDILGYFSELKTFPTVENERNALSFLAGAMEQNPNLYAIYVGYDSGKFFEVINLESSDQVRKSFSAAPHDRWVVIRIVESNGARIKLSTYFDENLRPRVSKREITDYDPRKRPWFGQALASKGIAKTPPYFFSLLKAPGVTYAKSLDGGKRVVAVDISLVGMENFLRKQQVLPQSQAFLFDKKGDLLAKAVQKEKLSERESAASIPLSDEEKSFIAANPIIRASNEMDWPPFDFALSGKPRGYSVDLLNLLARKAGFQVKYLNGYSWDELTTLFNKGDLDLLHSLLKTPEREKMGAFTQPYMPMPQAFAVKKGTPIPASIAELEGKTAAIPRGGPRTHFLRKIFRP